MTRDDIITALRAIERRLNNRIVVVRILIDARGHVLRRIYKPRDSRTSGSHYRRENHDR
jgi:hypothetical protein